MLFGMCNSTATFQAKMDSIFDDMITGTLIIVYIDDMFIFSQRPEGSQRQHKDHPKTTMRQ